MSAPLKIDSGSIGHHGCLAFAVTATALSLIIIGVQAWDKGASTSWGWVWTAFGMFTVLVVHGLFAVYRSSGWGTWLAMHLTWWICVCFVAASHVGFFLSLHEQAGTQRAEAIKPVSAIAEPARSLSQVRKEQESVRNALVGAETIVCIDDCGALRLKISRLKNRAKVLDAEEIEYLRWQDAKDRLDARRDNALEDPVMARLANWLGVTMERISLLMGLLFTMILESIGTLCWIQVARQRDSRVALGVTSRAKSPVTKRVATSVTQRVTARPDEHGPVGTRRSRKLREDDVDVRITQVRAAVAANEIRPTVRAIRDFLHCRNDVARTVRLAVLQT